MSPKVVAKKLTLGDVVGEMGRELAEMRGELDELWLELDRIREALPVQVAAVEFVYPVRAESVSVDQEAGV